MSRLKPERNLQSLILTSLINKTSDDEYQRGDDAADGNE